MDKKERGESLDKKEIIRAQREVTQVALLRHSQLERVVGAINGQMVLMEKVQVEIGTAMDRLNIWEAMAPLRCGRPVWPFLCLERHHQLCGEIFPQDPLPTTDRKVWDIV